MYSKKNILSRSCRLVALLMLLSASFMANATPTTPEGFRFDVYSETTGELFWLRSSGAPLVVGYELSKNGESLGVFDALSYVDYALESGALYVYSITAIDSRGDRSGTVILNVRTPPSPEDQIAMLQQELSELREQLDNSVPGPVASTGQTGIYQIGDDGYASAGVAIAGDRFLDNNDGTFTDRLTGITWLGVRNCIVKRNWSEAIDYSNTLADDGATCPLLTDGSSAGDWRLATLKELQSLLDVTRDSPAWAEGIPYSGNWSENPFTNFWSSTGFGPAPGTIAWLVTADYGTSYFAQKSGVNYTWSVKF